MGGDQDDVGILRIDDYRADCRVSVRPTSVQVAPASVDLNTPPPQVTSPAKVSLSCADIQDVGVAARYRDGADRRGLHAIENRLPSRTGIDVFPDAARCRAEIKDIR